MVCLVTWPVNRQVPCFFCIAPLNKLLLFASLLFVADTQLDFQQVALVLKIWSYKTSLRRYQKHFLKLRKKYIQCKLDWVEPFLKKNKIILIFRKLQMAEEMREAAGEDEQVNT